MQWPMISYVLNYFYHQAITHIRFIEYCLIFVSIFFQSASSIAIFFNCSLHPLSFFEYSLAITYQHYHSVHKPSKSNPTFSKTIQELWSRDIWRIPKDAIYLSNQHIVYLKKMSSSISINHS